MNIERDFEIRRNGGVPPQDDVKADSDFFGTGTDGAAGEVNEEKKAQVEELRKKMAQANSLAEDEENEANFKEMTEKLTR